MRKIIFILFIIFNHLCIYSQNYEANYEQTIELKNESFNKKNDSTNNVLASAFVNIALAGNLKINHTIKTNDSLIHFKAKVDSKSIAINIKDAKKSIIYNKYTRESFIINSNHIDQKIIFKNDDQILLKDFDSIINNKKVRLLTIGNKKNSEKIIFYLDPSLPKTLNPFPGSFNDSFNVKSGVLKAIKISEKQKMHFALKEYKEVKQNKIIIPKIETKEVRECAIEKTAFF